MANVKKPGALRRFSTAHPIITHIILIILTTTVLVYAALVFLDFWTHHGETARVPDVRHLSYTEATARLREAGLDIAVQDSVYNTVIAPGTVLESWPHAGAVVKPGREIYVTICSYQPKKVRITMPLAGVSSRQAISYLHSLGISSVQIVNVPSQYSDLVERALYRGRDITAGSEIPVNGAVTLEVGTVPAPVFEPDSLLEGADSLPDDITEEI